MKKNKKCPCPYCDITLKQMHEKLYKLFGHREFQITFNCDEKIYQNSFLSSLNVGKFWGKIVVDYDGKDIYYIAPNVNSFDECFNYCLKNIKKKIKLYKEKNTKL